MPSLPLIRTTTPGIYQVCATANADYPIPVPDGATGVLLWFETSASDSTIVRGRIGFDQAADAVTGLTGTDALLGYHPPMPVEWDIDDYIAGGPSAGGRDRYVHVAAGTAGAVVRGCWLFHRDWQVS